MMVKWVYLCLAIMCLKDLGIQEENDSINYEKFFNQCFSIYMKENETQSWNILKKKLNAVQGFTYVWYYLQERTESRFQLQFCSL